MRRELIEQQGFVDKITGYCRQSTTPTPTDPVAITTIAGDLEYDNTLSKVVAASQWYHIDGANKTQYLPLLLEGDTIEVNYRTMKAKITHRFRAVHPISGSPNTTASGGFYISRSNLSPTPKYGGKIYCSHCTWLGNGTGTGYSYGTCYNSSNNGSTSFWVENTAFANSSDVASWLSNHLDFIFVYELATPWTEEIDLTAKLRNHPLMLVGDGVELRTLSFSQGYINNLGNLVEDANYITSDYIEGGNPFKITCNTGYKVNQVHLFDNNNNIVSYKFWDNALYYRSSYSDGKHFEFELPKDYKMRVTVIANTQSGVDACTPEAAITPTDDAIESYRVINTKYYRREYLTDINYIYGYTRAKQLLNCSYTPLITKNYKRTAYPNALDAEQLRMGIPYSECGDKNKFIGKDVSFKTFVTAVYNPLSLFYTETPYSSSDFTPQRVSAYGYTTAPNEYVGTETDGTLYFGTVCACLADYVFGYDENYTSRQYKYMNFKGGTKITPNNDCSNIHPMDIAVANTHTVLIADVLKDIDGNVKFIQVIESVSPVVNTKYYTPDEFISRFNTSSWFIYHYNNLTIPKPEETPFISINPEDTVIPLQINTVINTIGGDYATFLSTDAIHLSVNNTSGNWQGVKVYDGNNQIVDTIYFTNTAHCTSHTITSLNQTWVDVNLSSYFANGMQGVYTATALNYSFEESEPTHFEVITNDVRIYRCANVNSISFETNTGDPYAVINGGVNGYCFVDSSWREGNTNFYTPHIITDAEKAIQNKGGEFEWPYDDMGNAVITQNYIYYRIMVKGQYGYATTITTNVNNRTNKATFTAGNYFDASGNLQSSANGAITGYMTVGYNYYYHFIFKDVSTTNILTRLVEYSYDSSTDTYTQIGTPITLYGRPSNSGKFITVRYRPTSNQVTHVRIGTVNNQQYKQFYYL